VAHDDLVALSREDCNATFCRVLACLLAFAALSRLVLPACFLGFNAGKGVGTVGNYTTIRGCGWPEGERIDAG
jgi:hypothetical protein